MRRCIPLLWAMTILWVAACPISIRAAESPDVRGAWRPELYRLKDGTSHTVTGLITFTEKDWSVLFFIMTGEGPQRASAEGGTYQVEGARLVFRHLYHFAGDRNATADLVMTARDFKTADAPGEPCTFEIKDNLLTIHFPSGNLMTFRRSSGF